MGNFDHDCLCCGWWTLVRLDQSLHFLGAPYTRSRETAVLCEKVKLRGVLMPLSWILCTAHKMRKKPKENFVWLALQCRCVEGLLT